MKAYSTIIVFFILLITSVSINAQQSDRATVDSFLTEFKLIEYQAKMAVRSSQVSLLREDLDSLFAEYKAYEKLIDQAVFPASFNELMVRVDTELASGNERLILIENQRETLYALNNQVSSFQNEIAFLNAKTDSLRLEIAQSMASEQHLAGMVRAYRQQLERRDELVFDLIDSLMISYQSLGKISGEEFTQVVGSTDQNPLLWIMTMVDENINIANSRRGYLEVEDYLRMYALQKKFEQAWQQIGHKMIAVYGNEEPLAWSSKFDEKLKTWRMVSSQNMWKSIDQYLEFNHIELAAFDNRQSFYTGLESFLEHGISESEDEVLTTNSYQDYLKLKEFWNYTFKNEWTSELQDVPILTVAQVDNIDQKLDRWGEEARPIHPMFVAIVALLIVSLSGFVLVMIRSTKLRYR